MKSIYCKINFFTLNFCWFKDEFSHVTKIALQVFSITKSVARSSTPKTNIWLKPSTNSFTYSTIRAWVKCTLSPLMIKFRVLVFRYNVFTLWFSEFKISTNFMDNYATFSTFKNVWKPSISKLVTKITKIKRLHLTFIPFMFGWSKLVSHHFVFDCACW